MKLLLIATIALALFAMTARAVPADDVTVAAGDDAADLATERGASKRVGGDLFIQAKAVGERYASGPCTVDAPLPIGYPAPTPPGAIEIKSYPVVRRAEVSGKSNPDAGRYLAFWPLFNHIKSRNIAMTAPVEVDYEGMTSESKGKGWTMAFLYRHRAQGDTGKSGLVQVKDAPAMQVISLGLKGVYDAGGAKQALAQLEHWLAANPKWVATGSPRVLFYNGPYKRAADRWSEVQIPIRAVKAAKKAGPEAKQYPLNRSL